MKKVSALFLLAIMTLSIFTACAESSAPQLLEFLSGDDDVLDLMGDEVIIYQETDYNSKLFEYQFNTSMYDAVDDRLDELGKKYNCEVKVRQGGTALDKFVQTSIATDTAPGDIIYARGVSMLSGFAMAGYLYPLPELKEYIDYEDCDKYGTAGILEGGMYQGIPYAVSPVQWLGFANSGCYLLVYNTQRFNLYNLTDPHEFYENKTWTWENYEGLIKDFSSGGTSDMYFLSALKARHGFLAMYSNNVMFCKYIDGEAKCDLDQQNCIDAIDWSTRIYTDYSDVVKTTGLWDITDFANESTLMTIAATDEVTNGSVQYRSEVPFSVMPFPCGPDGIYGRWAQWTESMHGFGIPVNSDRPEFAASFICDLFEPFEEFSGDDDLRTYYNENVFFDPLDTEILLAVEDYVRFFYYKGHQGMRDFLNELDSYKSAAEIISKNLSYVQYFVEDELKPNYVNYVYDHLYAED